MTQDMMLQWLSRVPFEPFEVQMSSGERYCVPHPEHAALTRASLIITSTDSECYVECSLSHITSVARLKALERTLDVSAIDHGLTNSRNLGARSLQEIEIEHILRVLDLSQWNKSRAAEILDIERSTLDRKLKRHNITAPD